MGGQFTARNVGTATEDSVRRRPGMYVGGTDEPGMQNLLWEVVGNVLDQHLRRCATELDVVVYRDTVTVRDDGLGIPAARFEPVLTTLGAGARLDDHRPHVHVTRSLIGLGLFVVNALSARFEVESTHDGVRRVQAYERGVALGPVREYRGASQRGTLMQFTPDREVFPTATFATDVIAARLQELAWLNPLLHVRFQEKRIAGHGGLVSLVETIAAARGEIAARFSAYPTVDEVSVDLALAWNAKPLPREIKSFVNQNRSVGGTHVDGIWRAFATVLEQPLPEVRERLSRGLVAGVHVGLYDARFANPCKDHLKSPEAGEAVARVIERVLPEAISADAQLARFIKSRLRKR